MMTVDQEPPILCAACGQWLTLHDVVIVSREVVPTWVSLVEPSTPAVFHKACELGGSRDDHNWMREAPRTLARVALDRGSRA